MAKILSSLPASFLALTMVATPVMAQNCNVYVVYDPSDTYVNVRKSPNGEIIRRIPNGAKTGVTGQQGDWYRVTFDSRFNDIQGYMKKSLLWRNTKCYAMDSKDTYVNLRSEPDITAKIVRQVKNGTPLTCLNGIPENRSIWVKVRVEDGSGKLGYMYGTKLADPSCNSQGNWVEH